MGVVVEMCLLIEKIVFLPEHPPFPKTGELLPKHDFCEYMFFLFFFGVFQILYPIYRRLNDQVYKHGKMAYNIFFLFLNSAICDFLDKHPNQCSAWLWVKLSTPHLPNQKTFLKRFILCRRLLFVMYTDLNLRI